MFMKTYQATQFPEIYKSSYWGNINMDISFISLIKTRDDFIINYNIKTYYHTTTYMASNMNFDHVEFYKTKDGKIILLTSPYDDKIEYFIDWGFIQVPNLYNETLGFSVIRIFNSIKDFNRFFEFGWVRLLEANYDFRVQNGTIMVYEHQHNTWPIGHITESMKSISFNTHNGTKYVSLTKEEREYFKLLGS